MAPCSNGVIKYNAVVVNSCDESIEFAVLIWPPPCIFNGHCDVGPLRMAPRLVLRTIGSRELQDGDFVRIVNSHLRRIMWRRAKIEDQYDSAMDQYNE